jgi:uncharacterized Zn-binding protein involved in type VI secretion
MPSPAPVIDGAASGPKPLAQIGDWISHTPAFEDLVGEALNGVAAGSQLLALPGALFASFFGQALLKTDPSNPTDPSLDLSAVMAVEKNGEITAGSPDTFYGPGAGGIVLAMDTTVTCSLHGPQRVAEGSMNVIVNGKSVARVDDPLLCGGTIRIKVDPTALLGALTAGNPELTKIAGVLEDMLSGAKLNVQSVMQHAVAYGEKLLKQEEAKLIAEAKAEEAKLIAKAKAEEAKLLEEAKAEGSKLLNEAQAKADALVQASGAPAFVQQALTQAVGKESAALQGALAGATLNLPF